MSSAIDYLFANMKCSKCGLPGGEEASPRSVKKAKCTCHAPAPLKNPVKLTCTECPATLVVEDGPDFMGLKEIATICPECSKDPEKS